MKKAIIDQIMLWIVIFVSFVTIFFMVIDYYVVVKAKDRCDTMSNYAVRMKALGRDENITAGLNNLSNDIFETIEESDISCADNDDNEYKIKWTVNLDLNTTTFKDKHIHSFSAAFNEVDSSSIDCNLTLRIKD